MAFVVETGEGLTNSNSYISVEFADDYFADRGDASWDATSYMDKQVALIRATDYININYAFVGIIFSAEQALEWPRSNAIDINGNLLEGIPISLKKATAELALIVLSDSNLIPNQNNDGRIVRERVEGAVEVEYSGAGYKDHKTFGYVDRLIINFGLAKSKRMPSGQLKIVRV